MSNREYTVAELIAELQLAPSDAKVRLQDADTNWTIPVFTVGHDASDNTFWFYPCDYGDMIG